MAQEDNRAKLAAIVGKSREMARARHAEAMAMRGPPLIRQPQFAPGRQHLFDDFSPGEVATKGLEVMGSGLVRGGAALAAGVGQAAHNAGEWGMRTARNAVEDVAMAGLELSEANADRAMRRPALPELREPYARLADASMHGRLDIAESQMNRAPRAPVINPIDRAQSVYRGPDLDAERARLDYPSPPAGHARDAVRGAEVIPFASAAVPYVNMRARDGADFIDQPEGHEGFEPRESGAWEGMQESSDGNLPGPNGRRLRRIPGYDRGAPVNLEDDQFADINDDDVMFELKRRGLR